MPITLHLIKVAIVLAGGLALIVWWLWYSLKSSSDPARLLARWVITIVIIAGGSLMIDNIVKGGDPGGKIAALLLGAVIGLCLAIIWVPPVVEAVGGWFGSLYTGGREPPTPTPAYSTAQARRKQFKYRDAIYEIHAQLQMFPTDVTGQMLLAEIQADDLKDLPAAQLTIERFCQQPDHAPQNIAFALNSLADWHLKLAQDPDAARLALEQILAQVPDTEQAQLASQRIAHLPTREMLLANLEHKPIRMQAGATHIGLRDESVSLRPVEPSVLSATQHLVEHLAQHPLDNEAREKLAILYADHYLRLDLAALELEQLISAPHQPGKEVARWLNLLADLQVKHSVDYEIVRATLQRVIDLFPGLAPARLAEQRIETLRLEIKGKEQGLIVKMGTYERDLGLKKKSPAP